MISTTLRWCTYRHHANFFDRIISGDLANTVLPHDSVRAWFEAHGITFLNFVLSDRIAYSADLTEDEVQRFEAFFG